MNGSVSQSLKTPEEWAAYEDAIALMRASQIYGDDTRRAAAEKMLKRIVDEKKAELDAAEALLEVDTGV